MSNTIFITMIDDSRHLLRNSSVNNLFRHWSYWYAGERWQVTAHFTAERHVGIQQLSRPMGHYHTEWRVYIDYRSQLMTVDLHAVSLP